jgi:glycosyltransferase involved in cell wall biosynthesis
MPLEDTPWTRAKCAFKLLQYMALGIPAIGSPVGMNREVVENESNGLLASTPDDWVRAVDRLLGDGSLRRRLAEAGRRTVEDRFSLDVVSPRLVRLLDDVIGRQRMGCDESTPG